MVVASFKLIGAQKAAMSIRIVFHAVFTGIFAPRILAVQGLTFFFILVHRKYLRKAM